MLGDFRPENRHLPFAYFNRPHTPVNEWHFDWGVYWVFLDSEWAYGLGVGGVTVHNSKHNVLFRSHLI